MDWFIAENFERFVGGLVIIACLIWLRWFWREMGKPPG